MQTLSEELEARLETIRKLQLQIGAKDRRIVELERESEENLKRAIKAEIDVNEVRSSLNSLTAAHGKLKREMKKLRVK